jgi:hypothetical protein
MAMLLAGLSVAQAKVSDYIPVGGVLTNTAGEPLTGKYDVVFAVYAEETGGKALWSETRSGADQLEFADGLFTAYLGEIADLDFADLLDATDLWLGVTVGTDNEMNRIHIGSVPFAMEAQYCRAMVDDDEGILNAVDMATKTWVEDKGYATQAWVTSQTYATQTWVEGKDYATQTWVEGKGYATKTWVEDKVYATQTWVEEKGYATTGWVTTQLGAYQLDIDHVKTCEYGIASIDTNGNVTCAASRTKIVTYHGDFIIKPNGTVKEYVHVLGSSATHVYLYLYGNTGDGSTGYPHVKLLTRGLPIFLYPPQRQDISGDKSICSESSIRLTTTLSFLRGYQVTCGVTQRLWR